MPESRVWLWDILRHLDKDSRVDLKMLPALGVAGSGLLVGTSFWAGGMANFGCGLAGGGGGGGGSGGGAWALLFSSAV